VEAGVCPSDNRPDDLPRARGTSWGFTFVDKFGVDQALRPGVRGSYALNALMNYNNAGDKFEDGARQIFALDGWWSWCGDYNAAWLMRSVVFGQTVDPLWPHWEATMVGWRHPRENIANALFLDGHVSPLRPRRPRSLPEIYSRTTDTARAFTWLPGEHPLRYDWEPYQRDPESGRPASYPGEIEDYFTRVPARVSGNTKAIRWGSGDGGVDWMPEDFPEELSCNWRTAFHRWRYFPSDPADRR
jgi:prepilin-type processing-associated H-X9-DG protein